MHLRNLRAALQGNKHGAMVSSDLVTFDGIRIWGACFHCRVSLVPCAADGTTVICMDGIAARVADGNQCRVGSPFDMPLDAIGPVPLDRWDSDAADQGFGSFGGRFGGFVDGWADFDGRAFGIGRPEAAVMDPQQRLLLEVCPEHVHLLRIPPLW